MSKRYRITLLVIILLSWGTFLFFYKIRDFEFGPHFETRSLVRNLSWQTEFRDNVPYKKGDAMEYDWIFSGEQPRTVTFDPSSLKNVLDIDRIELDGKTVREEDLGNIRVQDSSLLKITGKAKNTGTSGGLALARIVTTEQQPEKKESSVQKTEALPLPQHEPSDIVLTETRYNSNINNLVTLRGKNLDSIEFVNIGEKGIRPVYESGTLFVRVDRNTFSTGDYLLFFTLRSGKILTSDLHVSFEHSDSPINIANIAPKAIRNDQDRFVVIQGNGFDKIVSIQLSNNLILKNAEFNIIGKQVAGVKIPANLPPGEYYFNIMDTSSIYELKNMKFTVTN